MKVHYCPDRRSHRPLCEQNKSALYDRPRTTSVLREVTCGHCLATIRNQAQREWQVRGFQRR